MVKEDWANLPDEEKTRVIREFMKHTGLENFDYTKTKTSFDYLRKTQKDMGVDLTNWENPVLVLELVDPVMADMVFAWMYKNTELSNGKCSTVPFLGYNVVEFVFNKGSLMSYTPEEKEILRKAMSILKTKGDI